MKIVGLGELGVVQVWHQQKLPKCRGIDVTQGQEFLYIHSEAHSAKVASTHKEICQKIWDTSRMNAL